MTDNGDFEQRASRSIQASIAVKELLLKSTDVVSVVARVSELLVCASKEATRLFCLEMAEARRMHSTLQPNSQCELPDDLHDTTSVFGTLSATKPSRPLHSREGAAGDNYTSCLVNFGATFGIFSPLLQH